MKLYIPSVGDEIRLTSEFHFQLFNEQRNESLMKVLGDKREVEWRYRLMTSIPAMIPAGEVLKVDRIYIRKGLEEFDSITFLWKNMRTEPQLLTQTNWQGGTYQVKIPRKPVRFWVKLEDANTIEFERA